MPNNLQFLDDPDDTPFINENITLHVGVDGSDEFNSGLEDSPFRTLGKAVDVVRNKMIGKNNLVTIQIGSIKNDRTGKESKKYFEEEDIVIDFEMAKRLKIKGIQPTDHEIIGVSYFDKATDREGYYCQVLVTNQDKINIGDYLGIYDHMCAKKKDPSYFWVTNNIGSPATRFITTNNCYVEAIRVDMILGTHEVVDVSETIRTAIPTELFDAEGLQIGTVTLHIKNNNHTYKRLNQIPYYNTLGTEFGKPLQYYAAGAGNSPQQGQGNGIIPPVFYGADMLSHPETLETNGYEQFYYASGVQQIEIVDIMVRGYGFSLQPLDGKIVDPRDQTIAKDASILWNDPTLTKYFRVIVANRIATYFYKKMISDLRLDNDLAFYFSKSTNPFITVESIVNAAKKIRDYLISGANNLVGVPPWDENNHPGYGFGPFQSGAIRTPLSGGAEIDRGSYPSEYADESKTSVLLQSYNIYPPINGQLYVPTMVKRISRWYNDNTSLNGLQLDRWNNIGNLSPFFCGYITPQGWYKQRWVTNPQGTTGNDIGTLNILQKEGISASDGVEYGYYELFGGKTPNYCGNSFTNFNGVSGRSVGVFSNERSATKNYSLVEANSFNFELDGATNDAWIGSSGNTSAYANRGSMGSIWYSGLVNNFRVGGLGSDRSISAIGDFVMDRYFFGYETGKTPSAYDAIQDRNQILPIPTTNSNIHRSSQTISPRAKCFKSVLRFGKNGLCVKSKTKLGLIKDLCIVGLGDTSKKKTYGILVDQESVANITNVAVSGFYCGIGAKNQSIVNLLADLGSSTNLFSKVDPAAIVTCCNIGIESSIKSHVNARRSISTGSKLANYLAVANSSMDCSNTVSTASFKHGYVCEFNSYMKATNAFAELNGGVGFCASNNSILVCHRGRSLWNGQEGILAQNKGTVKCFEFICRGNDADGMLAKNKSVISAGANSSTFSNYRREFVRETEGVGANLTTAYYGIETSLPPHMFIVVVQPYDSLQEQGSFLPTPVVAINSNPTHGLTPLYHECSHTISEFNAGSGFAADTDSTIIADNTIARFNSKKYGEFFLYGWSGTRGSFPTDTFASGGH